MQAHSTTTLFQPPPPRARRYMEPAAYLPVAREQEKQVRGDRVSHGVQG